MMIGAGRLATNLCPALHEAGHKVVQVYSRTMDAALQLAEQVGAEAVNDVELLTTGADVYIFSVTDTALPLLIPQVVKGREGAVFLHTAGSVPMSVFADTSAAVHFGVLYPMQTFSKERKVDFRDVPFFIEGSDMPAMQAAGTLASSLSVNVRPLSSEARRHLHLAAVFACNFANHCYQLSAEILQRHGLPFDIMLPLVDETARKVHHLSPREAQTGPAVRYDQSVMLAQLQLLADMPMHARIYQDMSESIHKLYD